MPQNKVYTYNIKIKHHRDLPPKYLELIRDMLFKFIGDIPITRITILKLMVIEKRIMTTKLNNQYLFFLFLYN